ncbi:hypothetical protein PUN28_014402 [Cardiocondyla obscurior]|uniref:Uncharacterized protein n=1 Tax=Cardiocondyla obscurior TaxID=286306 RepID=A0AAW2EZW4_9HYME
MDRKKWRIRKLHSACRESLYLFSFSFLSSQLLLLSRLSYSSQLLLSLPRFLSPRINNEINEVFKDLMNLILVHVSTFVCLHLAGKPSRSKNPSSQGGGRAGSGRREPVCPANSAVERTLHERQATRMRWDSRARMH